MDVKPIHLYGQVISKCNAKVQYKNKGDNDGEIRRNNMFGLFYYRNNDRYKEVVAGYGKEFSFGMCEVLLSELSDRNVEYIFIETQYNIWEISVREFIDNLINTAVRFLVVCNEEVFVRHKKTEGLYVRFNKSPEDKPIKRKHNSEEKDSDKRRVTYGEQSALF